MADNSKIFKVTPSPDYETVVSYLEDASTPGFAYINNMDSFLAVTDENGINNKERILNNYSASEKEKFKNANIGVLPLKYPTILCLNYKEVGDVSAFLTQGMEVTTNDEAAFKAAELAKLESDINYTQVSPIMAGYEELGKVKNSYPDLTVWLWCRSLTNGINDKELSGELFDISPFVISCSTNSSKNGGNFHITLPPLVCVRDEKDKWILKQESFTKTGNEYMADDTMFSGVNKDGELQRNQFLFHNIIRPNDLIFIRFESLEMEKEQRYKDAKNFFIDKSMLAGRIYDLIGLIDSNTQTIKTENNDVVINVSGRDLSKLFIEDGTYFYAIQNSQGKLNFRGGTEQKNSLISRNIADGSLNFLGLYTQKSIQYVLEFVIQQLATIKVVPDALFSSYGDRVNTVLSEITFQQNQINPSANYKPQFHKEKARGIWQIIKMVLDESITNRRIVDSSMSAANGSLINFLRCACQEPFVEILMDSYSDMYYITVRKPPYDRKGLVTLLEGRVNTEENQATQAAVVNVESLDVISENLIMNDADVYSWYLFIPRAVFIGDSVDYSLSYLPALYFPEYSEVFGTKAYQQSHNYLPYNKLKGNSAELTNYEMQAFYDYKYLIESNQYAPFVRKGVIVLNGDRRIKIGNVIRYKPTGEIFFVDGVNQTYQITDRGIERTTTVEVSRGMIEQLIYGVKVIDETGAEQIVSYFDIINTDLNLQHITVTDKISETKATIVTAPPLYEAVGYAAPGFSEYMQHQQGARGTRQIADSIKTKEPLSAIRTKKMFGAPGDKNYPGNVGNDYFGEKSAEGFISYWLKKYNATYRKANNNNTNSIYEPIFQKVASETGVPIEVLRTFAEIESGTRNVIGATGTYIGLMQVTKEEGLSFGLNVYKDYDNVKTAALIYLRNKKNNPFQTLFNGTSLDKAVNRFLPTQTPTLNQNIEYKTEVKEVKKSVIDYGSIFNNYKVNKTVFNFFLKNLQFQYAQKSDINRLDRGGLLKTVTVTTKSKNK